MSRRNGDRSRFQVNRKRKLKKRMRVRAAVTALVERRAELAAPASEPPGS